MIQYSPQTKAFDNKTTVLHYLVQVVRESNKDILKFQEDIKSVVLAKNVVMDRLVTTVKQLCEESRIVAETAAKYGEEYRKSLNDPRQKDKFSNMKSQLESEKEMKQIATFLSQRDVPSGNSNPTHGERFALFSKLELQKALGAIAEANQSYIDLLQYFGEDIKTPQAFFGIIDQFMDRFDQVADHIEAEEQASMKIARQALAKEVKLRVKSAFKSAVDGGKFVRAVRSLNPMDCDVNGHADIMKELDDVNASAECTNHDESAQATYTARPSNKAKRTEEIVTVPYDEEVAGGSGTARKSASVAWKANQNTATYPQSSIQTSETKDSVSSTWIPLKVEASHPSELSRFSPSIGSTSIADMAAAAARKRNHPIKSSAEHETTLPIGKVSGNPTTRSSGINVISMSYSAALKTEEKEHVVDGARLVKVLSKGSPTAPKESDDRKRCESDANTQSQGAQKENVGRVEQAKLARK